MGIRISPTGFHSFKDQNICNNAAWHDVDRLQAESLLEGKPMGTYLFRKDSVAKVLEEELGKELNKRVECFTLTYSQEDTKVSDHTIVFIDGSLQIYNDDPSLHQPKFSDLNALIGSLRDVLKYPLYR